MNKRCKFKIKQIKIYILIYLFLSDEKTDNLGINSIERKEEEKGGKERKRRKEKRGREGRKREEEKEGKEREEKSESDHVSGSWPSFK